MNATTNKESEMKYAIVPGEGRTGNRMTLKSVHRTPELAAKRLGREHGRIIEVGDDARKGDVEFDDWIRGAGKYRVIIDQ